MKFIKFITLSLIIVTSFSSCNETTSKKKETASYQCPMKCEGDKVYQGNGSCPVCKMDLKPLMKSSKVLADEISDTSIFNLTTKWNTEEGETIELKDLKGKTLVMVMIYTSCKSACPRLAADMRNIEAKIPPQYIDNTNFVLVSIDPETDTPERLKMFAKENLMEGKHWTLLQGTESGVREVCQCTCCKIQTNISVRFFSFKHY